MTERQFRDKMNGLTRSDRAFWVSDGSKIGIAVGLDSGKHAVILQGGDEIPLSGLFHLHLLG